ncbi:hypothetical protein [Streptomyces bobili]|uniref:hypothetical protein n=1 Tax=Streptomyces bobili TaxID=67280 RepID=UPI00381E4AFF
MLSAARQINGLVRLSETLRAMLHKVATHATDWLLHRAPTDWFDPYAIQFEGTCLPEGKKQTGLIEQIGADGLSLLAALRTLSVPEYLRLLERVQTLRQMWIQQYFVDDGQVRRRDPKDRPSGAERLVTPCDTDARGSVKRGTFWDGYKVHLTETYVRRLRRPAARKRRDRQTRQFHTDRQAHEASGGARDSWS